MKKNLVGYQEAIQITLENIEPLGREIAPLAQSEGRVIAMDLAARVNSPSVDSSLKDGYALRSGEIAHARPDNSVTLKLLGTAAAGLPCGLTVAEGTAVRVLTGAKIPKGADAVLAEEFTRAENNRVTVTNFAEPGRNILPAGSDIALNECCAEKGDRLRPGIVGIIAASGYSEIPVFVRPRVAIIATGDEIVAPGRPLPEGKLYASNLVTLNAWCLRYGIQSDLGMVGDKPEVILSRLKDAIETHDALLTSGGAWTGDRDFVVQMLETLGWKQFFHRIRIGPGKAVGFGLLHGKPVFVLPGGPPSNLLAFLQIALPGLLKLGGFKILRLPAMKVKLTETVVVRDVDWTQFIFGCFEDGGYHTHFKPMKLKSRLQSMARAEGVMSVPEGVGEINAGSIIDAQLLI
jgi:molybdopterin molybdotransferase